jgi:uncharacterized protein (DUF1800 family)
MIGISLLRVASPGALEPAEVTHLLYRTGFGPTPGIDDRLEPLTRSQAVAHVLDRFDTRVVVRPPEWTGAPFPSRPDPRRLSGDDLAQARKAFRMEQRRKSIQLRLWWYRQMIETESPLAERMVLFWHNHFTTSVQKVTIPDLMYRQQLLIREHALGNFRAFVHAIAADPAMIIYLDNQTNLKERPNENFARELLELYTVGEGNYTESDIRAAARAFTGWRVRYDSGEFTVVARQHDTGPKTFMGRTGNWDGTDIVDIIFDDPRSARNAARHVIRSLWKEFISPDPDPAEVEGLADLFLDSDFELEPLLRAMLGTRAFWDPQNRGVLVKSPVELIVGAVRLCGVQRSDAPRLLRAGRDLGQDVFNPPSVKGWPRGLEWITSQTLLARRETVEAIVASGIAAGATSAGALGGSVDTVADWARAGSSPPAASLTVALADRLVPGGRITVLPTSDRLEPALLAVMTDPSYQLK